MDQQRDRDLVFSWKAVVFRWLASVAAFAGLGASCQVCPFCGQPGCVGGGLGSALLGAVAATAATAVICGRRMVSRIGRTFGGRRDEASPQMATLAGGCFWGVEEILRKVPGVIATRVGYTGGSIERPTYEKVKTGETGHAEAIEVTFDPSRIGYEQLLDLFFRLHDPTTANRQGGDVGTQYRSAIFVHSESQRRAAERARERAGQSKRWSGKKVVTEIVDAGPFFEAEDGHQKYLEKNPGSYSCHYLRD